MFCKHDVHGGLYKSYYKANYTRGEFCVQWSVGPLRRINTCRRKGKGRRCCLVDRNYSFLAALVVLHKDDLKNRMNFTRKIERKGWIHNILQNRPSTGWQIVMCVCVCVCVLCVLCVLCVCASISYMVYPAITFSHWPTLPTAKWRNFFSFCF